MQDTSPNGSHSCAQLVGTGKAVWDGNTPFIIGTSVLPTVKLGHILHMWIDEPQAADWNGHWVVSNGDGTICRVNNGEIKAGPQEDGVDLGPEVKKAYTKRAAHWAVARIRRKAVEKRQKGPTCQRSKGLCPREPGSVQSIEVRQPYLKRASAESSLSGKPRESLIFGGNELNGKGKDIRAK